MTLKLNVALQAALTVLQGANQYSGLFPKAQPYITLGLTLVQGAIAFLAHFSNPDGTQAATPYVHAK